MTTETIERRLRAFVAETDEPDWQDVLRRAGERPARPTLLVPRRKLALALAACAVAAATAVGFSGLLGSSHTKTGLEPPHFSPIDFTFTRDANGGLTSIDVTIRAATLGGTALLQVVHGPIEGSPVPSPSQVVFQEQVPMTDIASPVSGHPPGTEALSSWSGTLSTSDWDGGCQSGRYEVFFKVSPANPTIEASGEEVESGSLSCTG